MKFWSKRLILPVAAIMVGWLMSVGFAASGTKPSPPSSSFAHPNQKMAPGTSIPISAAAAFVQAAGQAEPPARGQAPAARGQAPARGPADPTIQTSDQVFKNIQVLKGLPLDEFMGTMGVFTTSLSLCCGNCHTGAGTSNPKWEDDPPRKKTARAMVSMVQAINRQSFAGRQVVTCWTCHRGQLTPGTTPPLDFAYGEAVVSPPDLLSRDPNATVTVAQVFDKFLQGLGGAAATNALTSYVGKGSSILYGEVGKGDPAEYYAQAPNKAMMITHQREGDVVRTYDGTTAWWQLPLTVTPQYQMRATLAEGARFDATMAFPWRIQGFFNNWRVSFGQTIDGTDVNVIQGSTPAGMIGTLYFDKETGLLKRSIRYAITMVGRIPTQVDYSDYRAVAGVKMPFKFSYAWVSQREEWTITDYQPNVAVDASKFGKPVNTERLVAPIGR